MASSPFVAKVRDRQRAGHHSPEAHDVRHHRCREPLITAGLTAVAVAAAAGEFAGISLVVGSTPIPVSGIGVLTVICSVVLARSARQRVRGTKVPLMLTHVVAATIVIPAIARRLIFRRSSP